LCVVAGCVSSSWRRWSGRRRSCRGGWRRCRRRRSSCTSSSRQSRRPRANSDRRRPDSTERTWCVGVGVYVYLCVCVCMYVGVCVCVCCFCGSSKSCILIHSFFFSLFLSVHLLVFFTPCS